MRREAGQESVLEERRGADECLRCLVEFGDLGGEPCQCGGSACYLDQIEERRGKDLPAYLGAPQRSPTEGGAVTQRFGEMLGDSKARLPVQEFIVQPQSSPDKGTSACQGEHPA